MKKFYILLATLVAAAGLSACETIEGAGEDIESVGDEIEDTAEEAD